jgi:hypothetical protein
VQNSGYKLRALCIEKIKETIPPSTEKRRNLLVDKKITS